MQISLRLLTVLFTVLLSMNSAQAGFSFQSCISNVLSVFLKTQKAPWFAPWFDRELQKKLSKHYDTWLEKQIRIAAKFPRVITSEKGSYKVIAKLGEGTEGNVFLVLNQEQKQEVIKEFKSFPAQKSNAKNEISFFENPVHLDEIRSKQIDTIGVEEINREGKFLRLEYIRGLAVGTLLKDAKKIGLSESEQTRIQKAFEEFFRDANKKYPRMSLLPNNYVLQLSTGRFVVIDAY